MPKQWKNIYLPASEIYPLIKNRWTGRCCWRAPCCLRNKGHECQKLSHASLAEQPEKVAPIQKEYQPRKSFRESWILLLLETHIPENIPPIWLLQCQGFTKRKMALMSNKTWHRNFTDIIFTVVCRASWATAYSSLTMTTDDWQAKYSPKDWQQALQRLI